MKATSYSLSYIASPPTLFGLPPTLLMLLAGAVIPLVPLLSFIGIVWISFVGPLLAFAIGVIFLWRLRRTEPHCETVYFRPGRFYRGKQSRTLIAGIPPVQSETRN